MTSYQHVKTTAEIMEIAQNEPWFYVIQPTLQNTHCNEKQTLITINDGCIQVVEEHESTRTSDQP